jgi:hypothetical protein
MMMMMMMAIQSPPPILRGITFQKTAVFKETTMKTSNITNSLFLTQISNKFWSGKIPVSNDNYTELLNVLRVPCAD